MKTLQGILLIVLTLMVNNILCRKIREVNIITANSKYFNDMSVQTILQDSIAHSVEIALNQCQNQFQWDRWNCPVNDFLSKRSSSSFDREAAFVRSITIAALIYTVAKNCSRGEIKGCDCKHDRLHSLDNNLWSTVSDCSKKFEFGERMAINLFDQTTDKRLDAQGYANIHNNRAGQIAVQNSLRKHCKCHGLSGSCSLQTCWLSLNTFPEIAADIRKMYDRAVQLSYNNNGHINTNIREDTLVYVLDSPNYCKENITVGYKGTIGRQCSRNKENGTSLQERRSCKNLCRSCGLRVRRQAVVRTKRCNCKFNWCCNVTCDICEEHTNEYYCY